MKIGKFIQWGDERLEVTKTTFQSIIKITLEDHELMKRRMVKVL